MCAGKSSFNYFQTIVCLVVFNNIMATKNMFNALVVDDDSKNIEKNIKYLGRNGFNIKIANNGQEAIELFRGGDRFHLVIMDMGSPTVYGYQVPSHANKISCRKKITELFNHIKTLSSSHA